MDSNQAPNDHHSNGSNFDSVELLNIKAILRGLGGWYRQNMIKLSVCGKMAKASSYVISSYRQHFLETSSFRSFFTAPVSLSWRSISMFWGTHTPRGYYSSEVVADTALILTLGNVIQSSSVLQRRFGLFALVIFMRWNSDGCTCAL